MDCVLLGLATGSRGSLLLFSGAFGGVEEGAGCTTMEVSARAALALSGDVEGALLRALRNMKPNLVSREESEKAAKAERTERTF